MTYLLYRNDTVNNLGDYIEISQLPRYTTLVSDVDFYISVMEFGFDDILCAWFNEDSVYFKEFYPSGGFT